MATLYCKLANVFSSVETVKYLLRLALKWCNVRTEYLRAWQAALAEGEEGLSTSGQHG